MAWPGGRFCRGVHLLCFRTIVVPNFRALTSYFYSTLLVNNLLFFQQQWSILHPLYLLLKNMEHTSMPFYLPADFQVRDKLLSERRIFLWGQVDDTSSRTIVEQLAYLEATEPGTPIHMYINCPGGMVTAGYAMYDMMQAVSSLYIPIV
jgi:hypothetical protein